MEYKNEKLGARFVVPDKITVRQQLTYISEASGYSDSNRVEKLWTAATGLITEWECPGFSLDVSLDDETNPSVASAIIWAALEVQKHVSNLENIPKN